MMLCLLLLLLCSTQASHFYGTMMTYYPKSSGGKEVVLRYKLSFKDCGDSDTWKCLEGDCGTESTELHVVEESDGEWCQREGVMTRQVPTNAPFQLSLKGGNWIDQLQNNVVLWNAVTLVELRDRSDTSQANRSPQTTILPALRVPSNCQRDFSLLAFDADGDEVKCREGNKTLSECDVCPLPSVLSLSSSCTLSFSSTKASKEGPYAVQIVMEDFPQQIITLTQSNGLQEIKTTEDAISKVPLQFVLRVDDEVPSCTKGLYLPKFLPPTPENRAQLYAAANQTLEIKISAEANNSTISELLFSGPYNVNKTSTADGRFSLSWTPSESEDGESHPICFVVEADFKSSSSTSSKLHSELRCVVVSVGNYTASIQSTAWADTTVLTSTTNSPSTTTMIHTTTIKPTTTQNTPPLSSTTPISTTATRTTLSTTTTPTKTTTPTIISSTTTQNTSPLSSTTPVPTTATSTSTTPTITSTIPASTTQPTATQNTTLSMNSTTDAPTTTMQSATTKTSTNAGTPSTRAVLSTTTANTESTTIQRSPRLTSTTSTPTTPVTSFLTTTSSTKSATTADVSNRIVAHLRIRLSSSAPLTDEYIRSTVIPRVKGELVIKGLPGSISLRLVSGTQLDASTTAPPVG